ncbi:MAG: hypothetical protein ACXVA0_23480 [Mucilaginibacter sp.]
MQEKIVKILEESPGLKAKDIAKKLSSDRKQVNSFLYSNMEQFSKDENHCWYLKSRPLIRIELAENSWIDCHLFEKALSAVYSPIDSDVSMIVIVIPEGCRILLEAAARLMALANQLIFKGKTVIIDFTQCESTLTFLNRIGFFDHLNIEVSVLPERPETSINKGGNDILVEFGTIDPKTPDESIPKQLKLSFVSHAGDKYSQAAFTVLTELFGNVRDHSESPIPGFVALQCYKNSRTPHIQTVISDSGKGIIGTLKPILNKKYPKIAEEISKSEAGFDELLLKKVFTKGEISQSEDEGRGLGLKSSSDAASKFNATILVRQETCEAKLSYKKGKLAEFIFKSNMPRIFGTHICFDFLLD